MKNKKIAFIIPKPEMVTKGKEIPLGLLYIGSVLRRAYYEPIIYDLTLDKYNESSLICELQKQDIKIVGLSFGTDNRFGAFNLCKKLKMAIPDIKIIAGGWHVSSAGIDTIKNVKEIDIIVLHEGEETIVELINALYNKTPLKNVNGIIYKVGFKIVETPKREFIKELDSIPWPNRTLINMKDYNQVLPYDKFNIPSTSIITARGCCYRCSYCSTAKHWGHITRFRNIIDVVNEIEFIVNNYGIKGIEIRDDTFTLSKKRVLEFCSEIMKRKLKIRWWCETRANTIDEEMIIAMKKAGCYYTAMAVESANEKTLQVIRKQITIKQVLKVVKLMNKHRVKLKLFFMLGLPGEGKEEIENTCNFLLEMEHKYKVQPIYSITTILPGTELEQMAKDKGIISNNFSWTEKIINPQQKYNLYFAKDTPLFTETFMSYERLCNIVRMTFIKYYIVHPINFIKTLSKNIKHIRRWL